MKTITLFSLVLILTVNSVPVPAPAPAPPVLDSDGKYLRTGGKYYVFPAALDGENGEKGGLLPAHFNGKPCPAGIEQSRVNVNGLSLTFTPVNAKKGVIRLSTDVNIKFLASTGCDKESNVWKVKYDKTMKKYAVMTGGVEGNPGPETLDNWFKIEKTKDGYKLVFCPSVCSYCKVMCKDVGIEDDEDGNSQRLVLSDNPASFVFWEAY